MTVKLNVPAAVVVPLMLPPASMTTPVGKAPAVTAKVYGAIPPAAASDSAYSVPRGASGSVGVRTMSGGNTVTETEPVMPPVPLASLILRSKA